MDILVIGVNFRGANIEKLEKGSINQGDLPYFSKSIRTRAKLEEIVILSTCNRVEIYGMSNGIYESEEIIKTYFEIMMKIPRAQFGEIIYTFMNEKAVEHLFKVVCSLDSLVVGEPQILGQVKDAYEIALSSGCTGRIFNSLFSRAFKLAKRVRTETNIGRNTVSIASVAVELAKKLLLNLEDKSGLLIGAGEMAEQTAAHLVKNQIKKLLVFSRSENPAYELERKFNATPVYDLSQALAEVDIVVSSTSSRKFIIEREDVFAVMQARGTRPLFLIDIAVPRDIDPDVRSIRDVYLYNIDDLKETCASNKNEREKGASQAFIIIEKGVLSFLQWLNLLEVDPVIGDLKVKIETLCAEEISESLRRLGHSQIDCRAVQQCARSLAKKILHDPISFLKETACLGKNHYAEMARHLFKLN